MSRKPHRLIIPRPHRLGKNSLLLSVRFRAEQVREIRRRAGPAPATLPETIRRLVDAGLKATRR